MPVAEMGILRRGKPVVLQEPEALVTRLSTLAAFKRHGGHTLNANSCSG